MAFPKVDRPWNAHCRDHFLAVPSLRNGLLALLGGSVAARQDWLGFSSRSWDIPPTELPERTLNECVKAFWDGFPDKATRWGDFSEQLLQPDGETSRNNF